LNAEDDGFGAVLQVVRYFNGEETEQHDLSDAAAEVPNLFGWHLGRPALDFLQVTGAALDVDEYDKTG
jgi:hypothetical protein